MSKGEHRSPAELRRNTSLWTGFLAGPIAWTLHLGVVYAMATWACGPLGLMPLHVATVACLVVSVAGGLLAMRDWTLEGTHWPSASDEGLASRTRFLSAEGVLTSALFTLVIIAQWLAVFLVDPCYF